MFKRFSILFMLLLAFSFSASAQEKVDLQMIQRIKQEGLQNSKLPEYLSYLTDVYSPRLAGSPQYREAGKWVVEKLKSMGLENSQMEPWGTLGRGWELEKFYMAMTSPQYSPLIAYPKAWTKGTNGVIKSNPVFLDVKKAEDLEQYKGELAGKIVLMQGETEIEPGFKPDASRYTDEELKEMMMSPAPGGRSPYAARMAEFRARRELNNKITKFLKDEGAAVTVEPSRGKDGTIFVQSGGSYRIGDEEALPSVVVSVEQYNRIIRILQKNIPVELEIEVKSRFVDSDSLGYNILAEIPGTDKNLKSEIVMLGGHFDTWHAGTGATDDNAGCAISMEALRILKALNVKPRRTIRIAMWDAEEVGLIGSRNYVKNHFLDREKKEKKAEYDKLSVYFNFDNGTGKIRGIYLQGNEAARPIFEEWLKPFYDLGANTVTIRTTGGTDHLSFDGAGLPGFQFIQDELDYDTRTHHSNMDVYDHAQKSDLIQASVIMAAFVYNAAMRDEKMPRKYFDVNAEAPARFRY